MIRSSISISGTAGTLAEYYAAECQAAIDLGLEYFVQRPRLLLNSLDTIVRPDQQDIDRVAHLLSIPLIARAQYLRHLPAPAALSVHGVVNALHFVEQIHADPRQNRELIPYYLSIAAAWNQIGKQLAEPETGPKRPAESEAAIAKAKAASSGPWPPPWLEFLTDADF